jgi:retron-type reverse transcriptase
MMHGREKSDSAIIAAKPPNGAGLPAEEGVERRAGAEGNAGQDHTHRAQDRESVSQGLDRVRHVARTRKKERFTALLHHVDVERLRAAYSALKRDAAPGVDGITWCEYGQDLERRLVDLHGRVHRGAYRAQPSRRRYIPKPDGRERPLGIAALEDKIVQRAVVEVLNAIYEEAFLGFSYGFRPGRGPHDALDALAVGITSTKVNYILDADIAGFFDAMSHSWLLRFVEHRIGDPRVIRLIRKWLKAGVMEDGGVTATDAGSPQGAVVSPLLANVYLHYVFDLWADRWRRHHAQGAVIFVRFADDRAPRRREEVRDVTSNSWQPCCTRDEGRPLGLGLQDQGPNHRKPRRSNGRGGERCGKRRDQTRQVCAGKTNASEPLLTCRKRRDVAKTRLQLLACDKARRKPADWPSGDRHEDGVRPARGSCAERGNLLPRCEGRPPRGRPPRSRVPMRGAGADGFVVPSKPGNAGGGKGPDTPADETGQPAMGGAGV